jgi:predicted HTH transcriptional regulator
VTDRGCLFEFKEKWNPRYVAKSVSAFANASGGYLIIGATQEPDATLAALPGGDVADCPA